MKKIIFCGVFLSLVLTAFVACGKKTFACGFCGQTRTGKPHLITVIDEELELCNNCFDELENVKNELDRSEDSSQSNLKTFQSIDVFQDIVVEYEGMDGEAYLKIINKSTDPFTSTCEFTAEPYENLSNGDTITIRVSYKDSMADLYGCIPEKETITSIVEGLSCYIKDTSQLSLETIKEFADKYLIETEELLVDDFIFSYQNVQYLGTYLCVNKDSSYPVRNELKIYLSYDEYRNGVFYQTVYKSRGYRNVSISSGGVLELEYDQYPYTSFPDDIIMDLNSLEDEYIVVKVD